MKIKMTIAGLVALVLAAAVMVLAGPAGAAAKKVTCTKTVTRHDYGAIDTSHQYLIATTLSCRKSAPWVLTIHGGSWINGTPSNVQDAVNVFYAHGWQVFNMEYRRGTDVTWAQQSQDLLSAVAYVKAHYIGFKINPGRGTAYGFSAGGHMAAWLGARPGEVSSVVSASGVVQPIRECNAAEGKIASEPSTAGEVGACNREQTMMGTDNPGAVGKDPAWDYFSPETALSSHSAPVWIIQGKDDPNLPSNMVSAYGYWLGQAHVRHVVVDEPGYGHDPDEIFATSQERSMLTFSADARPA